MSQRLTTSGCLNIAIFGNVLACYIPTIWLGVKMARRTVDLLAEMYADYILRNLWPMCFFFVIDD